MEDDGLFLLRYQMRSTLEDLKISIDDEDLISVNDDAIQPHGCRCPRDNFESWLGDFGCQGSDEQIDADFKLFDVIDIDKALEEAVKRFARHAGAHSFCHYSIVDSEIYRRCYGEHVGFKMFPDSTFSLLAKMVI